MKSKHVLWAAVAVCAAFSTNATATPWFADNFDSYTSNTDLQAAWSWETAFTQPGELSQDAFPLFSTPNSWRMRKFPRIVRNYRSLVPAIQAIDPTKNAVNGTTANPLVVTFYTGLESSGRQERTIMWLELVGQTFAGNEDTLFSAPTHNRGSYGVDPGVCTGPEGGKTCAAGYYRNVGQFCTRDSDCDAPMWLDFISFMPSSNICTVLDQSLELSRPALAFGVYGGNNGLIPKGVPGDHCAGLTARGVTNSVVYDGDRWSRLTSTYPPGASADTIRTSSRTTIVTLTIRDTDFDITVQQPVTCDFAGKCDNNAICTTSLAGTCVNNTCTSNGLACTTDADCNFCSDNITQHCTTDAECRTMTCVGGPNAGNACTLDLDCDASVLTCIGGSTDGATCSEAQGSLSYTCGLKTITKAHIPRQYLGAFQTVALGPGRIWEGFWDDATGFAKVGSEYNGYIDNIEISGGELVAVVTGSCCLADGSCSEATQAACTQLAGSIYNGDGTSCATATCATGACCTAEGCVLDKTQAECEDAPPAGLGGIYQGLHTTCENRLCCPNPFADTDWDGDVDQDDFGAFQICYNGTGAAPTGCECFDRNADTKIDTLDFTSFSACFTGANVPWSQLVTPTCTP